MGEHGEILGYLVDLEENEWRDLKNEVEKIRQAGRSEVRRERERKTVEELESFFRANGLVVIGLRRGISGAPADAMYLASSWPRGRARHLIVQERGGLRPVCGDLGSLPTLSKLALCSKEDACRRCTRQKPGPGIVYSIKANALVARAILKTNPIKDAR